MQVTKDDILMEMQKVTEGVMDVIVYPSASDKTKNRGFAFVEYNSHQSAAMALRKLMDGRVATWGHNIVVNWADPEVKVDEEIMTQVRERKWIGRMIFSENGSNSWGSPRREPLSPHLPPPPSK